MFIWLQLLYSYLVHKTPKSHNSDRSNWFHFSCCEIALGTADPVIHRGSQFLLASVTISWPCSVDLHERIFSKSLLYTFYGRNLINILTWKTDARPHWKQSLHLGKLHSYIPTSKKIGTTGRNLQTQSDRHMLLCQCTWIFLTTMLRFTHVACNVHEHWLLSTYHNINKVLSRLGSKIGGWAGIPLQWTTFCPQVCHHSSRYSQLHEGKCAHVLPDASTGSWRQRTVSIIYLF